MLSFWIGLFLLTSCNKEVLRIQIESEHDFLPVRHGLGKLYELSQAGSVVFVESNPDLTIRTAIDSLLLSPESFQIEARPKEVFLIGGDPVGLMYGLLDIKEQLETGHSSIVNKQESPALSFRAIKFNLPWHSYRESEALQLHSETCRDTNYWHAFLDMMAENRFNTLTLWSMHPYSYMVKTEKYPEGCSISDEELPVWEQFWHTLFRMAKERGIQTYMINWNIFVSPEFARAHRVAEYCINNEYFIPQGDTSEIVKDYTRECVKTVINKYPDLTGLGITLGEGMGGMTAGERQQWIMESVVMGARMASRKIRFIYRAPLSAGTGSGGSTSAMTEQLTRQALDTLSCFEKPITIELKFNWSHAHSTPNLVKVHGGKLTDAYWNPEPQSYKLAWMIRNEDFFMLRWGQPDFIRQHLAANAKSYVNGYFLGSECYIPAKDYITKLPGNKNKYAFERQWMYYKMWGRLMYKPGTDDEVFVNAFEQRFPGKGRPLFQAQRDASKVPLIIASYWNATWDFTLYSEGFISLMGNDSMRLLSLEQFCEKQPLDPDYLSIKEYLDGNEMDLHGKISPLQLADSLEKICTGAISILSSINPGKNTSLLYELSDIKAWSKLGLYMSCKIRSAIQYQKYKDTQDIVFLNNAVKELSDASEHWKTLSMVTEKVYNPTPPCALQQK